MADEKPDQPQRQKPGYGRPPVEYQIKKGEVRNPGGRTKAQRALDMQNAKVAAEIKQKLLGHLSGMDPSQIVDGFSGADLLRLLRDVEDRAHGTPRQSVEHTSPDGSMTPTRVEIVAVSPNDKSTD